MGYDFRMPGKPETRENYTYNVAPMFYAANPGTGIFIINGMTGERAVRPLLNIRTYMVLHRSEMEAMNPTNDWGDYRGALKLLDRLIEISQDNPHGEWVVD